MKNFHRRNFLKTAGTGLAVLAQWPRAASAAPLKSMLPVHHISARRPTVLSGLFADWQGRIAAKHPLRHLENPWGRKFWGIDLGDKDSLVWQVDVEEAGEYQLTLNGHGPLMLSCGDSRLTFSPRDDNRYPAIGSLTLPEGRTTIVAASAGDQAAASVWAIEAAIPAVAREQAKAARELRADGAWMLDAKYGFFFHWTSDTPPPPGKPGRSYQERVAAFDVAAFAHSMKEMGAGWVVLTTSHGGYYLPFPSRAIDARKPGRTCRRDLVADLARALGRYGIRLLLYYHQPSDRPEDKEFGWAPWWKHDKRANWELWRTWMTEVGDRWGPLLAGYWFDDGGCFVYPYNPPFEDLTRAAKTGYSGRMIAYNPWQHPRVTDFQDYYAGELFRPPMRFFAPGGWYEGLLPFSLWCVDGPWGYTGDPGGIRPCTDAPAVVAACRSMAQERRANCMNLQIYQDGTFNPRTVETFQQVRQAIRGTGDGWWQTQKERFRADVAKCGLELDGRLL
jgi:hypothetical protein